MVNGEHEEHDSGCLCPECDPQDCVCPHNGHHDGPECFCRHLPGCPEAARPHPETNDRRG